MAHSSLWNIDQLSISRPYVSTKLEVKGNKSIANILNDSGYSTFKYLEY